MANQKEHDLTPNKPTFQPKEKSTEWEGIGVAGSAQQAEEYADEYSPEIPKPGADGLTPTSSPGGSMRRNKDQ